MRAKRLTVKSLKSPYIKETGSKSLGVVADGVSPEAIGV